MALVVLRGAPIGLALVAACGFEHGALKSDGGGPSGDSMTVPDGAPTDGSPMDTPATTAFCNPQDLDLRVCFTFENNLSDGSSYTNNAVAGASAYLPGHTGQGLASAAGIPADQSLNLSTMTLKMWIKPGSLPIDPARMGLLDNDSFRMFINGGGIVRCAIDTAAGAFEVLSATAISTNVWTRVSCTYGTGGLRVYINGTASNTNATASGALHAVSTQTTIGQNEPSGDTFNGVIDEIMIWDSAVTP